MTKHGNQISLFSLKSYINPINFFSTNNNHLFLNSIISSLIFLTILCLSGFEKHIIEIFIGLPLLLIFAFNTNYLIVFSIALLFAKVDFGFYKVVTLSSIPLLISYIITYNKNARSDIHNPVFFPFLFYFASILPSFTNCSHIWYAFISTFNLVSFACVFILLGKFISNYNQIKPLYITYIIFSFLNGLSVIHESLRDGGRVFGFSGVVYIDFVCIAIIILMAVMLFFKGRYFFRLLFVSVFLLFTLFLTQTRNPLFTLLMTLIFGFVFLFIYSEYFSFKKSNLIKGGLIALLFSAIIILGSFFISSSFFTRLIDLFAGKTINVGEASDFGKSSIITRLMIWYTSINAFLKHPFIGIGAFSFPFDSQYYNTLPKDLYNMFVKGLSPHITYLAVLTETGLLGMAGFAVFLFSIFKMSFQAFKKSTDQISRHYSFGLLLVQVYIIISMCMSDAWLWGQAGMLWGLVLGISIANYRIITKSYAVKNN